MPRKPGRTLPTSSHRARACGRFPIAFEGKRIAGGRLWSVFSAEDERGAYLLIEFSGLLAQFDARGRRLLGGPYEVLRFDDAETRDRYARGRGWL